MRSSGDELVTVSSDCVLLWDLKVCTQTYVPSPALAKLAPAVDPVVSAALRHTAPMFPTKHAFMRLLNAVLIVHVEQFAAAVMQRLTRKKALGTGPNSATQAEYALDGNVLITVLKVRRNKLAYCTCCKSGIDHMTQVSGKECFQCDLLKGISLDPKAVF